MSEKDWRERLLSLIELSSHVFSFLNRKRSSFYNFLLIQSSIFIPFFIWNYIQSVISTHSGLLSLSLSLPPSSFFLTLFTFWKHALSLSEKLFSICEIKTRTIYSACHAIHPWSSSRIVLVERWWKESECKKEDEQERKRKKMHTFESWKFGRHSLRSTFLLAWERNILAHHFSSLSSSSFSFLLLYSSFRTEIIHRVIFLSLSVSDCSLRSPWINIIDSMKVEITLKRERESMMMWFQDGLGTRRNDFIQREVRKEEMREIGFDFPSQLMGRNENDRHEDTIRQRWRRPRMV